jgi:hypothetical protein
MKIFKKDHLCTFRVYDYEKEKNKETATITRIKYTDPGSFSSFWYILLIIIP